MNNITKEILSEKISSHCQKMVADLIEYTESKASRLDDLEKAVMASVKDLGAELVSGLCMMGQPSYAEEEIECTCGEKAIYKRMREGQCKGIFGPIKMKRAYYLCDSCHEGFCPSDAELGFCAGSISEGLDEILALMGAEFPFEEASVVLKRLTLIDVSPNRCRKSTESLGQAIDEAEDVARERAWEKTEVELPLVEEEKREHLYVSADGVTVNIREDGWRELRLGAVYTTENKPMPSEPDKSVIRTKESTFFADITTVDIFAQHLYLEAHRRGVEQANKVVFIGDGAHWLWRIADEYFPNAIQILDWYHAAEYIWSVANDLHKSEPAQARKWAKKQLKRLANSNLSKTLDDLKILAPSYDSAQNAYTYFSNHQTRMDYKRYRELGLQIGSGTIESACHHVIGSRLKGSGMRWEFNSARHIAKVRTRLRSQRWNETLALRPPPQRSRMAA